jgi:hypothetical protein
VGAEGQVLAPGHLRSGVRSTRLATPPGPLCSRTPFHAGLERIAHGIDSAENC